MVLCLAGCRCSDKPPTDEKLAEPFLACAKPYDDGEHERFELPPLTVERRGLEVTVTGIKRGLVVLGLLAGIAEPTDANKKNLDLFLSELKAAGAQAILVAGGIGLSPLQVGGILDHLAQVPVPVLVTLSFDEANAYGEGGATVYHVAIPAELYAWVERYVLTHYVPEKKYKRKLRHLDSDEGQQGV